MPDWFAITGAITNAASALDLGYRYAPTQAISDQDAGAILQKVDEILTQSKTVLDNHKSILEDDVYEGLHEKYRVFHWQMADESQGHRAIRDKIIRESRILSQLYASRESRQQRAQNLLASVEDYNTHVLSTSQAASLARNGKRLAMFPDIKSPPQGAGPKSFTSWFSFGRSSGPSSQSVPESTAESNPSGLASASSLSLSSAFGYLVAVTHVPDPDAPTGSDQGTTSYRRKITFESAGKRIDVFDDKRRSLSESGAYIDQKSLCRMALLAEQFLAGVPEGYQAVASSSRDSLDVAAANPGGTSTGQ